MRSIVFAWAKAAQRAIISSMADPIGADGGGAKSSGGGSGGVPSSGGGGASPGGNGGDPPGEGGAGGGDEGKDGERGNEGEEGDEGGGGRGCSPRRRIGSRVSMEKDVQLAAFLFAVSAAATSCFVHGSPSSSSTSAVLSRLPMRIVRGYDLPSAFKGITICQP